MMKTMKSGIAHCLEKSCTVVLLMILMVFFLMLAGCNNSDSDDDSNESSMSTSQEEPQSTEDKPVVDEHADEQKTLEDYTWAEIANISSEISAAADQKAAIAIAKSYGLVTPAGTLDGTQTKEITLTDGASTKAQIVGFLHDKKTAGGKAGITFILTDTIGERAMDSPNSKVEGSWEKSSMRAWLSNKGLKLFPSELRDVIVPVDKLSDNKGFGFKSVKAVSTTSDTLWLFSLVELIGKVPEASGVESDQAYVGDILNAQGSQYKLFKDANVRNYYDNTILERYFGVGTSDEYEVGDEIEWWLRSSDGGTFFHYINMHGNPGPIYGAFGTTYEAGSESIAGIIPGFCI